MSVKKRRLLILLGLGILILGAAAGRKIYLRLHTVEVNRTYVAITEEIGGVSTIRLDGELRLRGFDEGDGITFIGTCTIDGQTVEPTQPYLGGTVRVGQNGYSGTIYFLQLSLNSRVSELFDIPNNEKVALCLDEDLAFLSVYYVTLDEHGELVFPQGFYLWDEVVEVFIEY